MKTKKCGPERECINVPNWITITDAEVEMGQEYWFLSKVHYTDNNHDKHSPNYNGGRHAIYFQEPHSPRHQMYYMMVQPGDLAPIKTAMDKPKDEPAGNFSMFGNHKHGKDTPRYKAWMCGLLTDEKKCGLPSDKISGMTMPENQHVSFHIWWEKRTK